MLQTYGLNVNEDNENTYSKFMCVRCFALINSIRRSRGSQREKIMDGLATWLGTGKVLDTLAAVKDRDLWRDMIANTYKQGT
ncbi:hypothetical protein PoB_005846900 [Plakobranchus ocellatus]|uniref:Uncharacterized protein n=1 Tax=Plakobranchus ocellatus TaxID=259542 RepID=A0AAV4CLN3_9GAST|nr:hypothetical protein PoB_005846900 [Plakobranchus ocellatus]